MRAVLGIDAAWTTSQPSGVALAVEQGSTWSLAAASASYCEFLSSKDARQLTRPGPTQLVADVPALLNQAENLAGVPVNLTAVDMPLSLEPIIGRRASDDAVSKAYGAQQCGTHTPSATRPGQISASMRLAFEGAGYNLATFATCSKSLVEVYPHPALVELANMDKRLPYKYAKTGKYWPGKPLAIRREMLRATWKGITRLLDNYIVNTSSMLPIPANHCKGKELKAFEDKLDAVICCWIGICVLEGKALAYGDETSAIWIPDPTTLDHATVPCA